MVIISSFSFAIPKIMLIFAVKAKISLAHRGAVLV